ncbi:hypothetical protein QBC39DRAFT_430050 [Podospora conica]|nr:hypothetical protein QBC39DRAFT_430050 [Schizothecium conicum]
MSWLLRFGSPTARAATLPETYSPSHPASIPHHLRVDHAATSIMEYSLTLKSAIDEAIAGLVEATKNLQPGISTARLEEVTASLERSLDSVRRVHDEIVARHQEANSRKPSHSTGKIVKFTHRTSSNKTSRRGRSSRPRPLTQAAPPIPAMIDPLLVDSPGQCPNCGQAGTCEVRDGECRNLLLCRACGDGSHNISSCPPATRNSICRCDPIPKHVKSQCPIICRRCWIAEGCPTEAGTSTAPLVRDCAQHCGICNMDRTNLGHKVNVPYDGCNRPRCTAAHCQGNSQDLLHFEGGRWIHFDQDCEDRLCPQWDCRRNIDDSTDKCDHCNTCGYKLSSIEVMSAHKCQWTKEWMPLVLADKRLRVDVLRCKRDPSHKLHNGKDLQAVRRAGFERLRADYMAWEARGRNGQDPRVIRPVVECRDCFESVYGRYETQVPGNVGWLQDSH